MFENSHIWNAETGTFLSVKHQRIAEIIQEWDETVHLAFIPPALRDGDEEFPFAVIHKPGNGQPDYIIFRLKEEEVTEQLLARLWMNDTSRNDPLKALEAMEAAHEAMRLKEEMDRQEEQRDFAETMLRSPLHVYRHNGRKYT